MSKLSLLASSQAWYNTHKQWLACESCPLAETRHKVCLVRGQIPADILFVGEAPGRSENVLGYPFVGSSGSLLDDLIEDTWNELATDGCYRGKLRIAFTNILGCLPPSSGNQQTVRPPNTKEAKACRPRLLDVVKHCQPELVLLLGTTTKTHWHQATIDQMVVNKELFQNPIISHLEHPTNILRKNENDREPSVRRFILTLKEAITHVFFPEKDRQTSTPKIIIDQDPIGGKPGQGHVIYGEVLSRDAGTLSELSDDDIPF